MSLVTVIDRELLHCMINVCLIDSLGRIVNELQVDLGLLLLPIRVVAIFSQCVYVQME